MSMPGARRSRPRFPVTRLICSIKSAICGCVWPVLRRIAAVVAAPRLVEIASGRAVKARGSGDFPVKTLFRKEPVKHGRRICRKQTKAGRIDYAAGLRFGSDCGREFVPWSENSHIPRRTRAFARYRRWAGSAATGATTGCRSRPGRSAAVERSRRIRWRHRQNPVHRRQASGTGPFGPGVENRGQATLRGTSNGSFLRHEWITYA